MQRFSSQAGQAYPIFVPEGRMFVLAEADFAPRGIPGGPSFS
jgi:hypothetical protein